MDNELIVCPKGQVKHDELVIFNSGKGQVKVDVLLKNGTAWLSMEQMCELFDENEIIIGGHLTSIFAEGELREADTVRRDKINYYSLDVVLSLGFRVHSRKGQQFRLWVMKQLREKMLKD